MGIEALRQSLATCVTMVAERDREIEQLRDEHRRNRSECHRLRQEINSLHAKKASKMMDVAMEASVQAIEADAASQRRATVEMATLTREIAKCEGVFGDRSCRATQAEPSCASGSAAVHDAAEWSQSGPSSLLAPWEKSVPGPARSASDRSETLPS